MSFGPEGGERRLVRTVVALWCLTLPALASDGGPAEPSVKLTPGTIRIGAFYSGARLRIEGSVQSGSKALVVIRGSELKETFNWKERWGPIWVNAAKAHISGVPALFFRFSPGAVSSFLSREAIEAHQLDEVVIKSRMRIEPGAMDREDVRANFVILSTLEGRYREFDDGVKMESPDGDRARYWVDFLWPKKVPPGRYEVRVYECRQGSVIRQASTPLGLVEVGLPAELLSLSREHGFFYGVVAVVMALLAGFGIDFLVSRLRRRPGRAQPVGGAVQPVGR